MASEWVDSKDSSMRLALDGGSKIASDIRVKKQMFEQVCVQANFRDNVHQPVLSNMITTLMLTEMGKYLLVQASQEEVKAEQHQVLLDDVSQGDCRETNGRFGPLFLSLISMLSPTLKAN
jgi:hypothetical protein